MPHALAQTWSAALRRCGARADDATLTRAGQALLDRWTEPHRRYHTLAHLRDVLTVVDRLASYADDADVVRLAAYFHDAVYDPRAAHTDASGGNEARSADLARASLAALGLTGPVVTEVARLVLLTATHAVAAGDRNGAVLCDADLAILAATPERYADYAAAVREEYAHVPDAAFARGRAAVLQALLSRPALYATPSATADLEEVARRNLATELTLLVAQGGADPPRATA